MKKHYYITLLLLLQFFAGQTQQTPQYTQNIFNLFGLHPAIAGTKECIDMRIGYRTQWVGFEGAPKTAFANFHTTLNRKNKGHLRTRHGIGANVETDHYGPFGVTRLYGAYAFHVPVNHKLRFSMGLYAGIMQYRVDANKMTLTNYNDNAVIGGSVFIYPDVIPGVWLYSKNFFAGLTVRQILHNKIKKVTNDSHLRYHYIASAGKVLEFGKKEFNLIPSVTVKFASVSAPALDLNLLMDFPGRFQFGLTYRNTDAACAMARVYLLRYFSLGYSFDFTTSKIKLGSSNTHEIILGINTCRPDNRNSTECPVFN